LPLRVGELARPLLVARRSRPDEEEIPVSGAIATCVVERVLDGIAVGLLGLAALGLLGARAAGEAAAFARHATAIVTAAFAAVLAALGASFFLGDRAGMLIRRSLGRFSPRLADRAAGALGAFTSGLRLGSPRRVVSVLALTAAHWGLHVLGFILVASAFGFRLTPLMASTVLAAQVVGVMIPAGPGMAGTSQFFAQLGLSIFVAGGLQVPEVSARMAGFANSIWMLQFGQQVLLGLVFWLASRASLSGLISQRQLAWETRSASSP
ncbi:MAG TPA: lysylphosphatidylglycerol synthase domain-containing protein, partial [Myxococcales bacterium]|nr:lysylphosphatidylglycerol synthase domain-containing protein [Myxococcales bacterium]